VGGEACRAQLVSSKHPGRADAWRQAGSSPHVGLPSKPLPRRKSQYGDARRPFHPATCSALPLGARTPQLVLAFNLSSIAVIANGRGGRSYFDALPSLGSDIVYRVTSLLRSPISGAACPGIAAVSTA
jgi:hypothetical protein